MGNNLIHNYLSNNSDTAQAKKQQRSGKNYFQMPTVSSTIDSFDKETDKLIKPLDGKGHLVNGDLIHMPKEFVRDTVYTTKAFADGVRGKGNDHQLGKMNDLGLKMSGIAIATYLMTQKATPKTKAMEFIGFGTFLASMALWPKIALEIPARIIHGFNFRKEYIDDQGRKKFVTQDPNYIPFDLYKGDKKSEDLGVIGDRLGVPKNIPNRNEVTQEEMRKISVQNNTLWMMTAGIATPVSTALACSQIEKYITPLAENISNKKVNNSIDKVDDYLNGRLDEANAGNYETNVLKIRPANSSNVKPDAVETLTNNLKGRVITREDMVSLSDTLASGFDAEMKDAARQDITNLAGGDRYVANSASAERLANSINSAISSKDAELAKKVSPEKIRKAASEGIIRGAVKDMLTSVGMDLLDNEAADESLLGVKNRVSTNFKCKEVDLVEFLNETPETKDMSPVERLAHNIKSIVMKVNNSNPSEDFIPGMSELEQKNSGLKSKIDVKLQEESEAIAKNFYEGKLAVGGGREKYVRKAISQVFKAEAPRGPKTNKIFASINDIITNETTSNRGFVINDSAAEKITSAGKALNKYRAIDGILSNGAHFKVEKANDTVVANNWQKVSDVLIKELEITDKEMKTASNSKALTNELFIKKLEKTCSDKASYERLITRLAGAMAELDEKLDAPNEDSNGQMMNKIESGIKKNCTDAGEALGNSGMTEMKRKMVSSKSSKVDINVGSIMNSKVERLHSRVEGVHSTYMRLLQTCEFFHRTGAYERELAQNGGHAAAIARDYGLSENGEMNKEIIKRGKKLLLEAHTDKFYNKMGTLNNPAFYKTLMWSVFRPDVENKIVWNKTTVDDTLNTLDKVEVNKQVPRRVFEDVERKSLGQKLKEHMSMMYNSMGSIDREILKNEYSDPLKADGFVGANDQRACKRFDLLGKAPSDLLHDAIKQKSNTKKWTKMFAPLLAATFAVTVGAQFLFGSKKSDFKAQVK
ncbi:MAG: hypothetical protein LUB59_01470 [Candidatus Gastranaerophilales bacterium]|nr:hypothetical protein [Candidatus Gastranaerophilales bacterium]